MAAQVYNLQNALNWTLAMRHIQEARFPQYNRSYCGRFIHLTIGVCQAIPVVGQVLSLVELGMFKLVSGNRQPAAITSTVVAGKITQSEPPSIPTPFQAMASAYPILPVVPGVKRGQPSTIYPKTELKRLDKRGEVVRLWPSDLTTLGINSKQRDEIDEKVRDAFSSFKTIKTEKKKIIVKRSFLSHTFKLPLSVHIEKMNGVYHTILLPKKVFIESGERKIRWAYDLTAGKFMIKKRVVGELEDKIVKLMHTKRAARGIASQVLWRTTAKKKQMLESIREGTVSVLFNTEPFATWSCKRAICADLINDLYDLQTISITNLSTETSYTYFKFNTYPAAHTDLKLNNVLAFQQNGKWRAELCDFGAGVGGASTIMYSLGYTSPEYVDFLNNYQGYTKEQQNGLIRFNADNCQKRDIWSLGLVLLAILVERTETFKVRHSSLDLPPLQSLKACMDGSSSYIERRVASIKQAYVDTDLNQLQAEAIQKHPSDCTSIVQLFDVIRTMLKVNPKERANISDIKTNFEKSK